MVIVLRMGENLCTERNLSQGEFPVRQRNLLSGVRRDRRRATRYLSLPLRSTPSAVKLLANEWAAKSPIFLGGEQWRLRHVQRPPTTKSACSIKSGSSRKPGFNRWLVPPAALAIHLCIGMAYGFSVFWLPLAARVGRVKPSRSPAPTMPPFWAKVAITAGALFTTSCDWPSSTSAGCSRSSSCFSASPRRSGAAGSSAPARARPASSRRCAGAAAS